MINHITPEELAEAVVLSDKGYENCDDIERERWKHLYWKASFARAQEGVHAAIAMRKQINAVRG